MRAIQHEKSNTRLRMAILFLVLHAALYIILRSCGKSYQAICTLIFTTVSLVCSSRFTLTWLYNVPDIVLNPQATVIKPSSK